MPRSTTADIIHLSVRDLVQQVYASGDLAAGFISPQRALEGIQVHQVAQTARGPGYQHEVAVAHTVEAPELGVTLVIQGRIDGVFETDGLSVIEEIKSTRRSLSELEPAEDDLHLAQVKIYAFIYAEQYDLARIGVHLTYIRSASDEQRTFRREYDREFLLAFFRATVDRYLERIREFLYWRETRDDSIRHLTFPFPAFRPGQEVLIDEVTQAAAGGHQLFVQAPTGLGKTLATLYPAIGSLAAGHCTKIFYLTARTTTREAAEQALEQLRGRGLRLKSLTLTAKEKICPQPGTICESAHCHYLSGYYDRIEEAVREAFLQDQLTRHHVLAIAEKHQLCPFEFSLDLSQRCDCIICDYNYLFDPRVQLNRYFGNTRKSFLFLVDEAHNLVERSRAMYSAALDRQSFRSLLKVIRPEDSADEIREPLKTIDAYLREQRRSALQRGEPFSVASELPDRWVELLEDFLLPAEMSLSERRTMVWGDQLKDLYFRVLFFIRVRRISQDAEAYTVITEVTGNDIRLKLMCLDASRMIAEATGKGTATVFFSATFTPAPYFFRLLGGREGIDQTFELPSPFPPENLCLCLVDSISTRYRNRPYSYQHIADLLTAFMVPKEGNYLVFFPSFQYLEDVLACFQSTTEKPEILKQQRSMSEADRDRFLSRFTGERDRSLAGFVVTGGIFGESIDLPGDRLIGVAVIGVGLPQVNAERNLIRQYFDTHENEGFHFAYTYPGMNRVLQAAGRLIRTDRDRGALLLIDDRFATDLYRRLYPPQWPAVRTVREPSELSAIIAQFWDDGHSRST